MRDEFTTFDIINKLGIPRGRLREWMNEGFILPSLQAADGVGTKALFDRVDIYALVVFKHLIEHHRIARSEAAQIIKGWGLVLRVFKDTFKLKEFDEFIATYDTLRVIRYKKKLIVAEAVAADILSEHLFDKKLIGRFMDALGESMVGDAIAIFKKLHNILNWDKLKSGAKIRKSQLGMSNIIERTFKDIEELNAPYEDWDSILMINFRKIREEAEKVFD
jgi:hypothetical protein